MTNNLFATLPTHRLKKQIEAEASGHNSGHKECPNAANSSGTPESQANQGISAAVPLSHALGGRDMGHLPCGACDGSGCPTCQPEKFGLAWKARGDETRVAAEFPHRLSLTDETLGAEENV